MRAVGALLILVLVIAEFGLNPFAGVSPDRPWSRCGLDLCACTAAETEPFCPLCPGYGEQSTGCEAGSGCPSVPTSPRLVQKTERLGAEIPMLAELLGASLVIRLGGDPIRITPPSADGWLAPVAFLPPPSTLLPIDPPPPRPAARSPFSA